MQVQLAMGMAIMGRVWLDDLTKYSILDMSMDFHHYIHSRKYVQCADRDEEVSVDGKVDHFVRISVGEKNFKTTKYGTAIDIDRTKVAVASRSGNHNPADVQFTLQRELLDIEPVVADEYHNPCDDRHCWRSVSY